jgi:hypothetical protein
MSVETGEFRTGGSTIGASVAKAIHILDIPLRAIVHIMKNVVRFPAVFRQGIVLP